VEHAAYTQELRIHFDSWDLALRAGIITLFGGVCVLIGPRGSNMGVSLLGLVLVAPVFLVALRFVVCIVVRKPAVIVTPEWIESNNMGEHVAIMWQEIAAMFPYTQSRNHYVAIIPEDLDAFLARLPAWRRLWVRLGSYMTLAPFTIWTSALEVSPDEFWHKIMEYGRLHVPHFTEGLHHEEPSRTGDIGNHSTQGAQVSADHEHVTTSRRARPIKSRKQRWIERVSLFGTAVLVLIFVFPASLLLHQDHPDLDVPVLVAIVIATVVFGLAALPRTRIRGILAWCAFVSLLSAMGFAIADGWGNAVLIVYVLVSLALFVVMTVFFARLNRRVQRTFGRRPDEP
jgi:hypothetical protein